MEPSEETAIKVTAPPPASRRSTGLWWGIAAVAVLALACLGGALILLGTRLIGTGALPFLNRVSAAGKPALNQIALVDNNGNVWLVSPDGAERRQLTSDGAGYRFPTWSPDGRWLAFVGPDQANRAALYVSPAMGDEAAVLFASLESAPFYLYWAPDSQAITFLTQEARGLAMRLARPAEPGVDRVLGRGAPFYWVWAPASDRLLMHVGGARTVSAEAHLSLLDNQDDAQRVELDLAPGSFQAPSWSNDGQYIFYVAEDEAGRNAIFKTEIETLGQTLLTRVTGATLMVASPTGEHLAYLEITRRVNPPLGTAYVIQTDGQGQRQVLEDLVLSMYWSPDGRKLALLTPTFVENDSAGRNRPDGLAAPLPQRLAFRWWVYDLETETLEPVATFDATSEFLQTVPFFDQYHLSLTFWSPDSRYLVLSEVDREGDGGTVWIVDTTGQEPDRQVGEGTLAVWSWK